MVFRSFSQKYQIENLDVLRSELKDKREQNIYLITPENKEKITSDKLSLLKTKKSENIFLHSQSKTCFLPPHEDNFSLKFSFKGTEFYNIDNRQIAVDEHNFL